MERATLAEYQDMLRQDPLHDLLVYVIHQHRAKPPEGVCRIVWSLPQLVDIVAVIMKIPNDLPTAIARCA